MAKYRRTKEQRMISKLRRLQSIDSNGPNPAIKPQETPRFASFQPRSITGSANGAYGYVKRDLIKITILATLAIVFQIVLSLVIKR